MQVSTRENEQKCRACTCMDLNIISSKFNSHVLEEEDYAANMRSTRKVSETLEHLVII
jgi:hypothetical protein